LRLSDQQKEQIRFNTEMIKLLVVLLFGTVGGVISFILKGIHTGKDVLFTAAGILVATVCIVIGYRQFRATQKIINDGNPE